MFSLRSQGYSLKPCHYFISTWTVLCLKQSETFDILLIQIAGLRYPLVNPTWVPRLAQAVGWKNMKAARATMAFTNVYNAGSQNRFSCTSYQPWLVQRNSALSHAWSTTKQVRSNGYVWTNLVRLIMVIRMQVSGQAIFLQHQRICRILEFRKNLWA